MIQRIQRCVETWARETGEPDVDPDRFFCLDDSKGPVRGCFLLVFGQRTEAPVLVAKGAPKAHARMREGRSVYEIDFENLRTLERIGMNRDGPTTPAPLRMWTDDEVVITLQSALQGRLLKNLPGRRWFSPGRIGATAEMVLSWWSRLQDGYGVDRRRLDETAYRDAVLAPVEAFRQRFLLDPDEVRLLDRRFVEERRLLGAELPFMASHGDFCTANVMEHAGRAVVFDWEFPLRHELPLFDVFHFFASTRFPFTGVRGESSHFESFKAVFWGDNYFNRIVRGALDRICDAFGIERDWLGDLFLLSLIHIANLKFEGLVEVYGVDATQPRDGLASLWTELGGADKDVPFARIREGVAENVRFVAREGFPPGLDGAAR